MQVVYKLELDNALLLQSLFLNNILIIHLFVQQKQYINDIQLNYNDLHIDFGPLVNLKNGIDISQLDTVETDHKKYWADDIKRVWYNNEVHSVKTNHFKKVIKNKKETDCVYLDKIKIYVYWNDDRKEWADMNEN